jgi:hypothetical protein
LRPVVPPPNTNYLTHVTHLKEDGTVENMTIQSRNREDFEESLKRYILNLNPEISSISKKKVFDDLQIKKNRTEKLPVLQKMLNTLRPDIFEVNETIV